LLGVEQGDLYRDRDLVTAQRNLYQTGAYRFVEVTPVADSLQDVGDSVVTLRVTLFEDYMRDLSTEVGWATLDCFRTRAQVTDKNFLGGARRLELTGQLSKIGFGDPLRTAWTQRNLCYYDDMHQDPFSDVLNYSVNATVRQPTVFGTFATPALSLFRERRGEYRAYLRTTYIGGEASLFKALQPTTSVRLAYSLEYGQTTAEPALLCAVFNRCDVASLDQIKSALPLAIASAAVARVRTDNAVNPRSGYLLRAESRNSATFIGSHPSLTFAKGVGDIAWYHPLGWGNVFAVRVRGGGIFGGGVENGTRLPPPQERLYAGGATSVRGFQQNELGELLYVLDPDVVRPVVLDDSTRFFEWVDTVAQRVVPVGGNSLFVANIDYRVRDPFFPALLQYTLFADVGSVWNRERRLKNLGFTPYWTPGIGVRVFSPVGPIQVNVGYNRYRQRSGPALYTPPISLVDQGFTSVYCAVPNGTSPSSSGLPLVHNRPDPDRTPHWIPDDVVCPPTFRPQERSNFWRRLVFTFSIGPDF
jgi:outer membrane protein assembly factor BamA